MSSFPDRLKELRKLKGITQKQAAEALSMTERNYQRLEATSNPSNENLLKMADYFDVSTDYLLGRTYHPKPTGYEICAQRLIECRKAKNITEEDVAEYLGISVALYYKYESAVFEPTIPELNKLAEYFNTSVDYLVGFEPPYSI